VLSRFQEPPAAQFRKVSRLPAVRALFATRLIVLLASMAMAVDAIRLLLLPVQAQDPSGLISFNLLGTALVVAVGSLRTGFPLFKRIYFLPFEQQLLGVKFYGPLDIVKLIWKLATAVAGICRAAARSIKATDWRSIGAGGLGLLQQFVIARHYSIAMVVTVLFTSAMLAPLFYLTMDDSLPQAYFALVACAVLIAYFANLYGARLARDFAANPASLPSRQSSSMSQQALTKLDRALRHLYNFARLPVISPLEASERQTILLRHLQSNPCLSSLRSQVILRCSAVYYIYVSVVIVIYYMNAYLYDDEYIYLALAIISAWLQLLLLLLLGQANSRQIALTQIMARTGMRSERQ
jgi:hypothetical protein